MGNNNKSGGGSRRWFFSRMVTSEKNSSIPANIEKVKMLTADGKLVEISKSVLESASKNKKASNKEILHWMKNPSKQNS